jgi:hypothetical protein
MGEWQPIETAPKDGTSLLLWWPAHQQLAADPRVIGYWKPSYHCWQAGNYFCPRDIAPTHWMPLPPPPVSP